nr:uncharacterized protein LOC114826946 isoform X2 [Malus domestica]
MHPSPCARKSIVITISSFSLPLSRAANLETRKGTPASFYFFRLGRIQAGCKHTQLRRPRGFFRPSPAVLRRKEGAIINSDSVIPFWYSFAPSVYGITTFKPFPYTEFSTKNNVQALSIH